MKTKITLATLSLAAIAALIAQDRIVIELVGRGGKGAMAVPELRGSGQAQQFMPVFNETLWNELDQSGLFRMVPRTLYPLVFPQRPEDWKPDAPPAAPPKRGRAAATPANPPDYGLHLRDWAGPPVNATYLATGYTAVQGGRYVLFGYFYNVAQADLANAQVFGKMYNASFDEAGARDLARQFAAEILSKFGATSLAGTKIVFTSTRSGSKEIWTMDYDGQNQKQLTNYKGVCTTPAVSPDGTKVAFTLLSPVGPRIMVHSLMTGRRLPFYNQNASMTATPAFTPDGETVLFSSTAASGYAQLFASTANGSNLRRITTANAIDIEPKVNPKNPTEIVFVSGRSGPAQIYRMNIEGTDIVRLTTGEGDAANPSWHPDGQHIAFAWTRGFEPGNFNIFVMDVATRRVEQLTHGVGRNENPTWAPDGRHIVYSSRRGGRTQIYTMLADGTQVRQLTTAGDNMMPVWSK